MAKLKLVFAFRLLTFSKLLIRNTRTTAWIKVASSEPKASAARVFRATFPLDFTPGNSVCDGFLRGE